MSKFSANHIFNEFIESNFYKYYLAYTDDLVSTNLAGFLCFIPERMAKYSDSLPYLSHVLSQQSAI